MNSRYGKVFNLISGSVKGANIGNSGGSLAEGVYGGELTAPNSFHFLSENKGVDSSLATMIWTALDNVTVVFSAHCTSESTSFDYSKIS